MIITREEVNALEKIVENSGDEDMLNDFFLEHPHFLMTSQFDEFVSFSSVNERTSHFDWSVDGLWEFNGVNQGFFRTSDGQWLWLYTADRSKSGTIDFHSYSTWCKEVIRDDRLEKRLAAQNLCPEDYILQQVLSVPSREYALTISYTDLFKRLWQCVNEPPEASKFIFSPLLWTPSMQAEQKLRVRDLTCHVLKALFKGDVDLRSLHWKTLEDVVAELLSAQGMQIYKVTETPQGGRDLIARGELIPGMEPVTFAVEVKNMDVVGRPEISQALHQNRYFAALMFATSGRFTAGVVEEKGLPENRFRLVLKSGVAIQDMISQYGVKRRWHSL